MFLRVTLVGAAPSLLWLLLWCPLEALAGDKKSRKKKEDDADKKVALPHHSFAVPLAYDEFLSDWMVSGASLAERERLLLHPSVSERAAFVWNKQPLRTNNFEATVHFRVTGPKSLDKAVKDQSFAMWYVEENVTAGYNDTELIKAASWKAGLTERGMTLSGGKTTFKGFGAILSMTDGQAKSPKSVVSAIWNDGDRKVHYGQDVPAANAKPIDFRNTMNAAQLRVRFTPASITGFFKQSASLSWNECFKIDRSEKPVKPGGYIGFSAWSGTAGTDVVPDMVTIQQLEVNNFDTNSIGEEMTDVSKDIQDAFRDMLTDEHRHFDDQKSQTEHLERLTSMLQQHSETNKPADEKLFQDLEGLQGRVGKLDEDCKTLTKELQVVVGGEGAGLQHHIIGLRRLFVKDSAHHREKLDMVQTKITVVKQKHIEASKPEMFTKIISDSEELQNTAVASSSQTLWMLLAIVIAIGVIGLLMYNRMHYYERKHFL